MKINNKNKKLNIKLFKLVKKAISNNPARLTMNSWLSYKPDNDCKTVGCIAGWTCILSHTRGSLNSKKIIKARKSNNSRIFSFPQRAKKLLNINNISLFHINLWPYEFQKKWITANTHKDRAKIVCDAIDSFIKENQWQKK